MFNQMANAAGQIGISAGLGQANAAQGSILNTNASQHAYNNALMQQAQMMANPPILREKHLAPRLYFEVDVVTNGFVLAVGAERMIAKDLEELQQHFTAQVASMLLEKDK